MRELVLTADISELDKLLSFLDEALSDAGADAETQSVVAVCVEELFANVAFYAYGDEKGEVYVKCETEASPPGVTVTISDSGTPYNPLLRQDPDVEAGADERPIGGLGIYMVKQMMDSVDYEYRDGKNVLTVTKSFRRES